MSNQYAQISWSWLCLLIAILVCGAIASMILGYEDLANLLVMVIVIILAHVFGFEVNRIKSTSSMFPAKRESNYTKYISIITVTFLSVTAVISMLHGMIYLSILCVISVFFVTYWYLRAIIL